MNAIAHVPIELIFSWLAGNASASAIVPPESFDTLEAARAQHGIETEWSYADDPRTGLRRPAFRPIEGGRLALFEQRGIRHGDPFQAVFAVKEVTRQGRSRREMWLIDVQPIVRKPNS